MPPNPKESSIKVMRVPPSMWEWGRFVPDLRINHDQVPLVLAMGQNRTYYLRGQEAGTISCPKGSDKRFCTLQVAIHAGNRPEIPYHIDHAWPRPGLTL